jgi:hypothetical protein
LYSLIDRNLLFLLLFLKSLKHSTAACNWHQYISSGGIMGAEGVSFLGFSATIASVVMRRPATDAAF